LKVHSNGAYGTDSEFVYVDAEGNLLTACTIGFGSDPTGLLSVPEYIINKSEFEMEYTTVDPDSIYECLGEL
jgi:hypothetical protein